MIMAMNNVFIILVKDWINSFSFHRRLAVGGRVSDINENHPSDE